MPTVFHFEEMFGVLFENSKDLLILRNLELVWERINAYQLMIDFLLLLFALYIVFRKPVKPEKPLSDKVWVYVVFCRLLFLFLFK